MDAYNGILTLNTSLDREICSQYSYTIRVTDLIEHRLSTLLTLNINVNDVNDNGPRFEQSSYLFRIAENTQGNTSIRLNVTDADAVVKSALIFSIESDKDDDDAVHLDDNNLGEYFELRIDDAYEGAVFLTIKRQLDYERKRRHSFRVMVSDEQHMTDTTNVEVQ